jgi:adenylylsulfate kinase
LDKGSVIWLTGIPGSGKTTIARRVEQILRERNQPVAVLDGDEVRKELSADLGLSPEDREKHNKRVIYVAKILANNGLQVLIPLISPYRRVRAFAREQLPNFNEVWVRCPVQECIKRDPKGLYAKALRGEIKNLTGLQDTYEEPENPELILDTDKESLEACADKVLALIRRSQEKNGQAVRDAVKASARA